MARKVPSRKALVAKLDKAYADYIKARDKKIRGKCAFCPKPIEHCFHFVTRGHYVTRWDEANAAGSCAGCNLNNEFNPDPYRVWYVREFGFDAYDQLVTRSKGIAKFSNEELIEMAEKFRRKLGSL
jgi:hypothetical protein